MKENVASPIQNAFFEAIKKSNNAEVLSLITQGANIEEPQSGVKPLYLAVQQGNPQIVGVLLDSGVEIGSREEDVIEIIVQAGPAQVRSIGCYDGNTHTTFSQEGIDYLPVTKILESDSANKLKNIKQFTSADRHTKIPFISHHIYFSSKENPRKIDVVSLSKTRITLQRLNKITNWKHYFWTNDIKLIPDELIDLENVEVRLIEELQNSMSYSELNKVLSMAKDKAGFVAASDIARIMVLLEYGGIYFDLDYEVYRAEKLIELMQAFEFIGGKEASETSTHEARLIGNSIIASSPNHPIIIKAIELVKRNYNSEAMDKIPDYLKYPCTEGSRVAYKAGGPVISVAYYLAANDKTIDIVLPSSILYNFLYAQSITPESPCYRRDLIVQLDDNAIGADMFCGGWTMNSGKMNVVYYPKNLDAYLFEAAALGYTRVVEYFFNKGANIYAVNEIGGTPLYIAAQNGHLKTLKFLLKHGANLEDVSRHGLTALYIAVQNQHIEIVRMLLSAGANVNVRIPSGSTPLCLASYYGYVDMVNLLLQYGAEKNVVVGGVSLKKFALERGHTEVLKLLNAETPEVDCYAGETKEIFAQEGINYFASNRKLMLDSKYKLSHLAEYVRDVSKIPQITHQIYFSSPTAPLALDKLSIEITLKTLTRLNQGSALFKHYFWTNNFDIVPQRIKDIANLEIRLINELENHLLYPLLLQMLEASSTNSQILLAASDLARLIALKEFGGSYRDLDYEIYRSERLLELIKAFTFLGGKEFPHDPVFFGSAFIAATKDHHIINKALELFKRNFDKKNVPEYVQYPCHKVFKQVYETGPAVITMAIHKAANQGENVDLILPGYHLFNMDYANANNQDSLCYTARKLSLEMYPDTIGADLFCGSWHKKKGAEDRIYYPKNLFKAVRNGDKQAVKFLLEQGVSIENGPDIPSIEENVMEILLPLGNGRVSFIGCYDSNQESIFTQEGISYQQENQKLIQDATYKIKHSNKFVGKQKIPNITHQVYFSSKTSPKPMDNISQKKVSINVQRLKNFTEDWRHIIWTNDFNLIPENIKNIPKVEVRLVGELEGSSLYPSVVVMLEMSSRDHKMLVAASDVARLIALQKFGGIYYDLDYEIFRPERLFDLMKSFNFFAGKEGVENDEKLTLIGNAILASSPNHLVINRAIEIANNNIKGLGKEYSKYPCSKSSELVFKAGGPIITMAYLLVANKDGNCDVVMPNTIFYNFDYIRSQTPESLCHVPGKEAVLGEDAIGADMFCGSWHQNKEFYNLNYYPKNNDLYLFKAAMFGYTRIVEYFIKEKGADVNTLSTIGATPLHISIQENHFSTVQYLLANKADLEIKASNNLTGLAIAVQKKHKRIARLLLEAGANTETIFPSEVTPLYVAIYLKDQDMAVLLIEHGANKDTVVLEARHKNDLEVLKGISEMEEFYNNKLFTAAQIGDLEMAMQAIAAGANINYIHTLGATSLYIASQNGHLSLVNLLIKNGAKLDLAIADGRTSLFIAAFNGHSEVVAAFIEAGADMEISSQGHTPLYAAIYNGFKDVVILLLKSGASIENNLNRFTPMFIAASKGLNKKALQNDRDIYQIVLEYYWEIVKKMHVHHAQFHNEKSFEVVIARYNEPTDWIAKEFPSEKVTIYNKGDEITDIHSNWHIVNIPNVGLEPYSYFTHIVTNYASLADRVLFMQGTPYDHPVYLPLSLYKKNVISGCKNIIAKCENTTVKFEVDAANNALLNNWWASYDGGKYANVVVRNGLLEFMQKFICPYPIETAFQINWGAEFAVDKENILRHPVEYYESFLSSLDIQFPGEVHWLERLWDLVFQECHY